MWFVLSKLNSRKSDSKKAKYKRMSERVAYPCLAADRVRS
jgi:hypothetical protein